MKTSLKSMKESKLDLFKNYNTGIGYYVKDNKIKIEELFLVDSDNK